MARKKTAAAPKKPRKPKTRKLRVELTRTVPERLELVVEVPTSYSDEKIVAELHEAYDEWADREDAWEPAEEEPREEDHSIIGPTAASAKADFVIEDRAKLEAMIDKADTAVRDLMDTKVAQRLRDSRRRNKVIYSAYKTDKNHIPIDNLDEVAHQGKLRLVRKPDGWCDKPWQSPVLTGPTWLDLCEQANESILFTRDNHHVYFEGFNVRREEDGVAIAEICMGS